MVNSRFDPADPFPLWPLPISYEAAKLHAEAADAWLGLETARVEHEIQAALRHSRARASGNAGETHHDDDQQLWRGLPVASRLTPYVEFRRMLHELSPRPGSLIVDLGAGYGRMGFVVAHCFPRVRFLGYELVKERVTEGSRALARFGALDALKCADLVSFRPEEADYYFIYDYGSRVAIAKTLGDLRDLATRRAVTVIGRGRLTRDTIERNEPWLSQVIEPRHVGNFSIYRSAT